MAPPRSPRPPISTTASPLTCCWPPAPNAKTADEYGETPLTLAAANGDSVLVEHLIKASADPLAAGWDGETALMIAAGAGGARQFELLIAHGAGVNLAESRKGQTALMWAAAEGHPDVVKVLIDHKAEINAASKAGFTALVFAAMKNDPNSVAELLAAGATRFRPARRHESIAGRRRQQEHARGSRAGGWRSRSECIRSRRKYALAYSRAIGRSGAGEKATRKRSTLTPAPPRRRPSDAAAAVAAVVRARLSENSTR